MKEAPIHIGVLSLELFIPLSQSLKSKRRVLKSLKDRVHHKFNVSIAEVGAHDKWQRAEVGACMISNDKTLIEKVFQEIRDLAETNHEVQLTNQSTEFV